jgi:DNA repair protein RecO (recombination protein O)
MNWEGPAIILSARAHGEGAAVVQLIAREHGRYAGFVHGRRRQSAALQPGSLVEARWRSRVAENLGVITLEATAVRASAALLDRTVLAALSAACAIAESVLPERDPHPAVFDALDLVFSNLGEAHLWPALYVRWELGLLTDLGFGLELERCALTGTREDLGFISPKSGKAASRAAGAPHVDKLLALPRFLTSDALGNGPSWADIADGLALTGHFLETRLYAAHNATLPDARGRLAAEIARLAKVEG